MVVTKHARAHDLEQSPPHEQAVEDSGGPWSGYDNESCGRGRRGEPKPWSTPWTQRRKRDCLTGALASCVVFSSFRTTHGYVAAEGGCSTRSDSDLEGHDRRQTGIASDIDGAAGNCRAALVGSGRRQERVFPAARGPQLGADDE